MFGNGGDDGHDSGPDPGQIIFGYLLWRELQSGRLAPGDVFRAGCAVVLFFGAIGGVILVIALASVPSHYGGTYSPGRHALPGPGRAGRLLGADHDAEADDRADGETEREPRTDAKAIGETETDPEAAAWGRHPRIARQRLVDEGDEGPAVAPVLVHKEGLPPDHRRGCPSRRRRIRSRPASRAGTSRSRGGAAWSYFPYIDRSREPDIFGCDGTDAAPTEGWVTFEVPDCRRDGPVLTTCLPDIGCGRPTRIRLR